MKIKMFSFQLLRLIMQIKLPSSREISSLAESSPNQKLYTIKSSITARRLTNKLIRSVRITNKNTSVVLEILDKPTHFLKGRLVATTSLQGKIMETRLKRTSL